MDNTCAKCKLTFDLCNCPDLPPAEAWDFYDYFNRWAEQMASWARVFGLLAVALMVLAPEAHATWKPEYAQTPEPIQQWFKQAKIRGPCIKGNEAYDTLGICLCCYQAERLRTKFVALPGQQWMYYPDPECVTKGCTILPIPDYIVHEEEIHAADPKDDALPQFEEMRLEGVLFIYQGKPSCFWPPTQGGG